MTDTTQPPDARCMVFAAMRNEGPFILEWVCWYKMLGFDILIATNDCSDHSVQLLKCLEKAGWLSHVEHQPGEGEYPKVSAHRAGKNHPLSQNMDWIFICDSDEFLNIHTCDTIQDFVGRIDDQFLGVALHWRVFGTSAHEQFHDGLLHRSLQRAAPRMHSSSGNVKSIFRNIPSIGRWSAHVPGKIDGQWGIQPHILLNGNFTPIQTNHHPSAKPRNWMPPSEGCHEIAQVNHYALRTRESYSLKIGVPSSSGFADRYTDQFFNRFDRNEEVDLSALRFAPKFDAMHAEAKRLSGVLHYHHLCCADYVARICERKSSSFHEDPRWQHHMHEAELSKQI